jgi:hypothetical protein
VIVVVVVVLVGVPAASAAATAPVAALAAWPAAALALAAAASALEAAAAASLVAAFAASVVFWDGWQAVTPRAPTAAAMIIVLRNALAFMVLVLSDEMVGLTLTRPLCRVSGKRAEA